MAALDGEAESGRGNVSGPTLRLAVPWRWLILVVVVILAMDILVRVLESVQS